MKNYEKIIATFDMQYMADIARKIIFDLLKMKISAVAKLSDEYMITSK